MATVSQNPGLCDYCQQKQKFGNYNYCGKTCSQQAAAVNQTNVTTQPQNTPTLCKQCNQKPRFQNFEFCGKNCASTYASLNGNANPPTKKSAGNTPGQMPGNMPIPNKLLGKLPQPLQAKIQAALPTVAAALQPRSNNQPQQQHQQPPTTVNLNVNNVAPVPPPNVPHQSTVAISSASTNPNTNQPLQGPNVNQSINGGPGPGFPVPQNTQGQGNGTNNAVQTSVPGQAQAAIPTTCRLTGCGKPVYMDTTYNLASEYCSKRHREEAVATGQVTACIMCLKMPRCSADHFCSKVCREAALSQ